MPLSPISDWPLICRRVETRLDAALSALESARRELPEDNRDRLDDAIEEVTRQRNGFRREAVN